jgi:hypothetical protein
LDQKVYSSDYLQFMWKFSLQKIIFHTNDFFAFRKLRDVYSRAQSYLYLNRLNCLGGGGGVGRGHQLPDDGHVESPEAGTGETPNPSGHQVSSAVGMIWAGGRRKPFRPVSRSSMLGRRSLDAACAATWW